ncbi:MAG: FAD-binding oxidoreductase [Anaerolineales bacterium]
MNSILPSDHLERIEAWGRASSVVSYLYRPTTVDGIRQVLNRARQAGVTIGLRGGGYSYGDAPVNAERITLDLSRMNRILDWDPESGVISVEPGVTIEQLWRYVLGDGWWPAVVPGTMFPTVGGCLGMNVHGKNNMHAGTFGDHVLSFEALLPNGDLVTCSRDENEQLFYAMIGGLGLLGCVVRITIQLQRVRSGLLAVRSLTEPNIEALIETMESLKDDHEYLVGWVDGISRGRSLGRGQIHTADYLEPGEDPSPTQSLRLESQDLPDTFFGLFPKSILWLFMKPFFNNLGVPWINRGRYWSARLQGDHLFRQSLTEFNFLLDYIPHWKRAYGPGGLVQFQCLLPHARAADTIRKLLAEGQRRRMPTYLGVLKRHRPDDFLLTHAVDGYSMAMDYRVTDRNRKRLAAMFETFEQWVLDAGGRFYFAKDSALTPETAHHFLGGKTLSELQSLKQQTDPNGLLETNLSRRVFPNLTSTELESTEMAAVPAAAGQTG